MDSLENIVNLLENDVNLKMMCYLKIGVVLLENWCGLIRKWCSFTRKWSGFFRKWY